MITELQEGASEPQLEASEPKGRHRNHIIYRASESQQSTWMDGITQPSEPPRHHHRNRNTVPPSESSGDDMHQPYDIGTTWGASEAQAREASEPGDVVFLNATLTSTPSEPQHQHHRDHNIHLSTIGTTTTMSRREYQNQHLPSESS